MDDLSLKEEKPIIVKTKKGEKRLYTWKKGCKSPNPKGRSLGQKNYVTLYKEALIKIAKNNGKDPIELELEIIQKGLVNARAGDYKFYKDVMDRVHGMPRQAVDLTTNGKDIITDADKSKANDLINNLLV